MSQPIGRMALDKSIVITGARPHDGAKAVADERRATPDLLCSSCGRVVVDGLRRTLFVGMVLHCNGCGERNTVQPVY